MIINELELSIFLDTTDLIIKSVPMDLSMFLYKTAKT